MNTDFKEYSNPDRVTRIISHALDLRDNKRLDGGFVDLDIADRKLVYILVFALKHHLDKEELLSFIDSLDRLME